MFLALCFYGASSNVGGIEIIGSRNTGVYVYYSIGVNSFTIPSDMHSASLISPISGGM